MNQILVLPTIAHPLGFDQIISTGEGMAPLHIWAFKPNSSGGEEKETGLSKFDISSAEIRGHHHSLVSIIPIEIQISSKEGVFLSSRFLYMLTPVILEVRAWVGGRFRDCS